MKKTALTITLLLLATSVLFSCAAQETAVYSDPTKTIFTTVGKEFTIALQANPTTGYQWTEQHNTALLSLVSSEFKPSKQAKGTAGAGGIHYFKFKALKPGRAIIEFTYKHPQETTIGDQISFNVIIE